MKQLDLFPDTLNFPNDFDGAHQVGGVNAQKQIDPPARILVQTPVEQQWNVTFGSPNGA